MSQKKTGHLEFLIFPQIRYLILSVKSPWKKQTQKIKRNYVENIPQYINTKNSRHVSPELLAFFLVTI